MGIEALPTWLVPRPEVMRAGAQLCKVWEPDKGGVQEKSSGLIGLYLKK